MYNVPLNFACLAYGDRSIRTCEKDGKTWFATPDILNALGYPRTSHGVTRSKLRPHQIVRVPHEGQGPDMVYTCQTGVISICGRSRKDTAASFLKWFLASVVDAPKTAATAEPSSAFTTIPLSLDQFEERIFRAMLESIAAATKGIGTERNSLKITTPKPTSH